MIVSISIIFPLTLATIQRFFNDGEIELAISNNDWLDSNSNAPPSGSLIFIICSS